jgi:L-idonate 5-dehydrogenase
VKLPCAVSGFVESTSETWLGVLCAADIPCFKVASPRDLLEDAQLNAVDFFELVDHPSEGKLRLMRSPIRFNGQAQGVEFGLAVDLINGRRVDLRPLLSGVFSLDDAIAAFEAAGDRSRSMKIQLAF